MHKFNILSNLVISEFPRKNHHLWAILIVLLKAAGFRTAKAGSDLRFFEATDLLLTHTNADLGTLSKPLTHWLPPLIAHQDQNAPSLNNGRLYCDLLAKSW